MSFILDALKKSEAERRQGEVPSLQSEIGSAVSRRRTIWPFLLIFALLLNGAVLGGWLLLRQDEPPLAATSTGELDRILASRTVVETVNPVKPVKPVESAKPVKPAESVKAANKVQPAKRTEPVSPSAKPAVPAVPAPAPAPAESFPLLSELPADVRAGLPALNLQLHFFSPDPARRMVRLNGFNLREGARGGDGLSVVEITPGGIRLSCKGVRFFLPTPRR